MSGSVPGGGGVAGGASRTGTADLERLRIDRRRPPERSPRRWLFLVGSILGLVVLALVLRARSGTLPWSAVQVEETAVALRPARSGGGAAEVLTANGYIQARRSAAVSAELQGRLAKLLVQEGSRVKQGELLAELANEDLEARLARAEAETAVRRTSIVEARAEQTDADNGLARAQALFKRDLATQAELDAAQARHDIVSARIAVTERQLTAAQAEWRVARAELAKTRIRAPFDGTVLRKNAEVGEMVAPVSLGGTGSRGAIVTIASLDSLDVEVDVNEAYIMRLRVGQPARVTIDASPDTSFAAPVRQIVPTSDRQKATVLVKAEILHPEPRLLPDMGAKVTFLAAGDSAAATALPTYPLLPQSALQRDGNQVFVWLLGADRSVQKRSVTTGATTGSNIEIRSGLTGGETVVVRAARPLRDGMKVRLRS